MYIHVHCTSSAFLGSSVAVFVLSITDLLTALVVPVSSLIWGCGRGREGRCIYMYTCREGKKMGREGVVGTLYR